ncbi:MAG: 3-dehydroquinate synthase [Pirellulaceae bacterium]
MSGAEIVPVALAERSYDIEVGSGNLPHVAAFLTARSRCTHAVVVTDHHVESLWAAEVIASLRQQGLRVNLTVVPAGERTKCVATADELWQRLLEFGTDRKSAVVAVGGGVIGDLAGFVAATYARGLPLFQVPTTLLAQVDSSVGGKVGVNLPDAKNMVGAFWQPRGVCIDTDVLRTLPDREYRAGLAEVVKYGVILDADFFHYLEQHVPEIQGRDPAVLRYVVAQCCRLKALVVSQDEREETGLRAVLNYGHTFCHAIEAVTDYGEFLHGEAVAIGMDCAARLAACLDRDDRSFVTRQRTLLTALDLPVHVPQLSHDALLQAMQHDKKVEHGQLRFVLPTRLGHVELVGGVASGLVRSVLADAPTPPG